MYKFVHKNVTSGCAGEVRRIISAARPVLRCLETLKTGLQLMKARSMRTGHLIFDSTLHKGLVARSGTINSCAAVNRSGYDKVRQRKRVIARRIPSEQILSIFKQRRWCVAAKGSAGLCPWGRRVRKVTADSPAPEKKIFLHLGKSPERGNPWILPEPPQKTYRQQR